MSKLLINEPPLQVLPTLACEIGLNEAIFVQQLHYWIENRNVSGKISDGRKWIGNSAEEWKRTNFPFWSTDTIQRTIKSASSRGIVLIRSDLNSNKFDKTNWYSIDYDALNRLPQDAVIDDPGSAAIDNSKMRQSYIETSTETNKKGEPPSLTAAHRGPTSGLFANKFQQAAVEFMEGMRKAGVGKEKANTLVYHFADIIGKKSQCEDDDHTLNEARDKVVKLASWGYTTIDALNALAATCKTHPHIGWRFKNKDYFPSAKDMMDTAGLVRESKLILLTAGTTTTPAVAKEVKMATIVLHGKTVTVEVVDENLQHYRDPEDPCKIIDDTGKQRGFDDKLFEAMYVTKSNR